MTPLKNLQWEFGSFRLDGVQHLLFRDGKLVPLSRKAADILVVLLENHGQLVEKEALMRSVWPDSFVEESNLAVHISQLRKTLSEEDGSSCIETIPRRGYRFVGELNKKPGIGVSGPLNAGIQDSSKQENSVSRQTDASSAAGQEGSLVAAPQIFRQKGRVLIFAGVGAACMVAVAIAGIRFHQERGPGVPAAATTATPHEKDTIVLADIANNTGDPIFNTTLRQAMAIELEQSPYLRLVPESRIQQSLHLMGRPADEPLTPEVSRELCQRNGSEAVLDGWIAKLGPQYVLGIRAVNCRTGDLIADLETTAAGRDQVLKALGDVTGQIRTKLGESLSTVQKFDTPIEEATTPSLQALQAYSIGKATMIQKGDSALCVPFFQRAVRLDPDFAIAYAALGNAYSNLGEAGLAAMNIRRAYELRQRVSEHEKLYIEAHYYQFVTGDLAKATGIYQTWAATYPDDFMPRTNLSVIETDLGEFDSALENAKAALRIAPDEGQHYANLANAYISLDRLNESRASVDEGLARKFDSSDLHLYLYDLAFLQHDRAGMGQQMKWAAGEPGIEDLFLGHYADCSAFDGQDKKAREFTVRAVEAAKRAGQNETAAGYEADAAQREALFGNPAEAAHLAGTALTLARDHDTKYAAAVAFSLAGSVHQAETIADQLNKDYPDDTIVQFMYLPTIRGAIALEQKDPAGAIKALDAATPYELGVSAAQFPIYIRGLAYLQAGDGHRAQIEFEKIVAHPGVLLNSPLSPMTRLQLARAYQLQGEKARAKAAYQDLLARWKDADPDLPILRVAQVESAKQSAPAAR